MARLTVLRKSVRQVATNAEREWAKERRLGKEDFKRRS